MPFKRPIRMRYRVEVFCDTEIEAESQDIAWEQITNRVQEIVNREYADQREGREPDAETDDFLYGITLRLPGSMIITGVDLQPGYDDEDSGVVAIEGPKRPELLVLRGGKAAAH